VGCLASRAEHLVFERPCPNGGILAAKALARELGPRSSRTSDLLGCSCTQFWGRLLQEDV
jgi:hypothetical protein